jgi:hypothetical protein
VTGVTGSTRSEVRGQIAEVKSENQIAKNQTAKEQIAKNRME